MGHYRAQQTADTPIVDQGPSLHGVLARSRGRPAVSELRLPNSRGRSDRRSDTGSTRPPIPQRFAHDARWRAPHERM
jgi:hypothetical protein